MSKASSEKNKESEEIIQKAQEKWQEAKAFAKQARWEAAVKAGSRAIDKVDGIDDGLYGDWSRQLREWKVRSGDAEALKRAGYALFFGQMIPRKSFFFRLSLIGVVIAGGGLMFFKKLPVPFFSGSKSSAFKKAMGTVLSEKPFQKQAFMAAVDVLQSKKYKGKARKQLLDVLLGKDKKKACRAFEGLYHLADDSKDKYGATRKALHVLLNERKRSGKRYGLQGLQCRSGLMLQGLRLQKVNLAGAALVGAHFQNVHFEKVSLAKVKAKKASFDKARLIGVRFSGADLTEASFVGARLTGARFYGAKLKGSLWAKAKLAGALFSHEQFKQNADLAKAAQKTICLTASPQQDGTPKGLAQDCWRWHRRKVKGKQGSLPPNCPTDLAGATIVAFAHGSLQKLGQCPWQSKYHSLKFLKPTNRLQILKGGIKPIHRGPVHAIGGGLKTIQK